jgi:hypothetical protein
MHRKSKMHHRDSLVMGIVIAVSSINKKTHMENENKPKQDCGCSDPNCCAPKKNNLCMKIIFIVIVVAAIGIVAVKLINNKGKSELKGAAVTTEKSSCGDTSNTKACDPSKNSPCCSKAKK